MVQSGFSTSRCDAGFEELAGDAVVQAGGGGDHRGVELIEQAGVVGQGFGVALGGHPMAIGRQRIDDGHQFDVVARGEFLGVESAQASRADDGHSQLCS